MSEYHQHTGGDVVPGPADRCIDPNAGAFDVQVLTVADIRSIERRAYINALGAAEDAIRRASAVEILHDLDAAWANGMDDARASVRRLVNLIESEVPA